MKKVLYIFSLIGLLAFSSCADELNTEPTDKVSGSTIFADASILELLWFHPYSQKLY